MNQTMNPLEHRKSFLLHQFIDGIFNMLNRAEAAVVLKVFSRALLDRRNPYLINFKMVLDTYQEPQLKLIWGEAQYGQMMEMRRLYAIRRFYKSFEYGSRATDPEVMDEILEALLQIPNIKNDCEFGIARDAYALLKASTFFCGLLKDFEGLLVKKMGQIVW